jgi:branched-chain amino acid transport system substrate-binding protein
MNFRRCAIRRRPLGAVLGAALLTATLTACSAAGSNSNGGASNSSGSSSGPIVIGASLPLSGTLASFGAFDKWGYQHAVSLVNAAGGIKVDGKLRKVKLVLLDSQSDPNSESTNIQQLITKDHAVALLGSCTPAEVTPGAIVAERSQVPMVTGCDPIESFTSVQKWHWVWDEFFSVADLARAEFQLYNSSAATPTNKKIAILHDNGPDGEEVGKTDPLVAKKFGDKVVMNATFPTTATDFSSLVASAKASGADIVLVDAATPQAVSIRKQMAADGFTPKILDMEKGAEPQQFQQALGKLANGVLVGGYWDPSFPYPGASTLRSEFEKQTGQSWSQHIADSDTAAQILLDAIRRAGSTDATKINTAIGETDKTYVVGPIKFDADHTSTLPVVMDQWQGKGTKVVSSPLPSIKPNGKLLYPLPGS